MKTTTTNLYYVGSMGAFIEENLLKTPTIKNLLDTGYWKLEKFGDFPKDMTHDEILAFEEDDYKIIAYWDGKKRQERVFASSDCRLYTNCEINKDCDEDSKIIYNIKTKKHNIPTQENVISQAGKSNCSGRLSPFYFIEKL